MPAARSRPNLAGAREHLAAIGLPCVIRPGFTLGGRGGGIAYSDEQFERIVQRGLEASPIGQVLLDQSVIGWGEFELEVMRDGADNVVIVCSIENVDPMGVHTGDWVTVAPQQSLPDHPLPDFRDQAISVIRAVGVEIGGSNGLPGNPVHRGNPRDRDEPAGLAFLGAGVQGDRVPDREDRRAGSPSGTASTRSTTTSPVSLPPASSRRSTTSSSKWPRFAFEKFPGADQSLTTHMKSVGEAMAFGRTFAQAFAKALRSRELDTPRANSTRADDELLVRLRAPSADRYEVLLEAAAAAGPVRPTIREATGIDPWFLREFAAYARRRGRAVRRASVRSARSTRARPSSPRATPYYYSGWERRRRRGDGYRNGRESG